MAGFRLKSKNITSSRPIVPTVFGPFALLKFLVVVRNIQKILDLTLGGELCELSFTGNLVYQLACDRS